MCSSVCENCDIHCLDGNTGVGTGTPATKLEVFLEENNPPTGTRAFRSQHRPTFTSDSSTTPHSNDFFSFPTVNSNVTFSGSFKSFVPEALRNNIAGADDSGTMSGAFIANYLLYGHNDVTASTPITNIAVGLQLHPTHRSGTISNLYDLWIDAGESGGNVTSHTAIYQESTTAQNIFNGKTGINESSGGWSTNAQLAVKSDINAATFHNIGTSGWSSSFRVENTAVSLADFRYGATQVGSIITNGTATGYNTTSDRRLKSNIADSGDAGAIIDALHVRSWDWISNGAHEAFGLIAQEEAEVYPNAVFRGDDNETIEVQWGRDDSKLVPLLLKEIQSLRNRVFSLETK